MSLENKLKFKRRQKDQRNHTIINKKTEKVKDFLQENNQEMAAKYKKRIQNFIMKMLQKPIIINRHNSSDNLNLSQKERKKMLGDPNFYVKGYKHQKDRIQVFENKQEIMEKNKTLDFKPNTSLIYHKFRERDIQKERKLHPSDMRFQAKTSLERVQQFIQRSQLQAGSFKKKNKKFFLKDNLSLIEKKAIMAQALAKNLLPQLHQKTHFQAVSAMYNQYDGKNLQQLVGTLSKKQKFMNLYQKDQIQMKIEQMLQEQKLGNKNKPMQSIQNFDPKQTSKQVLIKCNFLDKLQKKPFRIGDGHTMSSSAITNKELYENIYKKKNLK